MSENWRRLGSPYQAAPSTGPFTTRNGWSRARRDRGERRGTTRAAGRRRRTRSRSSCAATGCGRTTPASSIAGGAHRPPDGRSGDLEQGSEVGPSTSSRDAVGRRAGVDDGEQQSTRCAHRSASPPPCRSAAPASQRTADASHGRWYAGVLARREPRQAAGDRRVERRSPRDRHGVDRDQVHEPAQRREVSAEHVGRAPAVYAWERQQGEQRVARRNRLDRDLGRRARGRRDDDGRERQRPERRRGAATGRPLVGGRRESSRRAGVGDARRRRAQAQLDRAARARDAAVRCRP